MSEETYSTLFRIASEFRSACEQYRDEHYAPFASMKYFPRACCTLSSEAFLRHLRDEGIHGVELLNYMTSRRLLTFHDLVSVHGWAIDITADQFPKEHRPVIVRKVAELPKAWTLYKRFTLDQLIEAHAQDSEVILLRMYQDIRKFLPATANRSEAT